MAQAIGAVLAFAVGVGISPIPIIAVIAMLFSNRARVNGPAFLVGWVVGLSVVVTVTYLVADRLDVGTSDSATDGVSWLKLGLGLLLVSAAGRKWRNRPRPDAEVPMPTWMAKVDHLGPGAALGLGALLAANPKNLMLALAAGTTLAQVAPTTAEAVVGLAAFVVIGSSIVAVAVIYDLVGGEKARARLDDARSWLILHNNAVMAVLFLVFGAVLVAEGLGLRR
ncbi:MAG TPA: GAP family protein [Acidimicrobiales bacterium]